MNRKLAIIDYGSAGNSGFYISQIVKNLEFSDVVAFVHKECDGKSNCDNFVKIFGYLSVKSRFCPIPLQKLSRLLDLYFGLFAILIRLHLIARYYKVVLVINIYQSFKIYDLLLYFAPKNVVKVLVVHDAEELAHNYPQLIMVERSKLLKKADAFLVHNEFTRKKISPMGRPIFVVPFPLATNAEELSDKKISYPIKILFLGHARKEKGIQNLVKAFGSLPVSVKQNLKLSLVGSNVSKYLQEDNNLENIHVDSRFVSDDEFNKLILLSDFVIFPYTGGTNSGVYANACSLIVPSITSNISLFRDSVFYSEELAITEDNGLGKIFEQLSNITNDDYLRMRIELYHKVMAYQVKFELELNQNILRVMDLVR